MRKETLYKLIDEVINETLDEKKKKKQQKGKKRAKKVAKRKKAKKDACYRKVKSRYKVWPSAYASGALVKCRKVGAKNWGNKSEALYEEESDIKPNKLEQILKDEGGASGLEPFMKAYPNASEEDIVMTLAKMLNVARHENGDYILDDDKDVDIQEKKDDLRTWFNRKGEKGSKSGWVDCNAPDGDGGYKSCSPGEGEKRKKYPACRPTPARCKDPGKGTKWGKKSSMKKETLYELIDEVIDELEEKKKKKPCKPSKGKRFAKRVDGKCRSYGQKGKAKDGGDRIRPGTKKGDAYCARSAKIKKCKNPPCANDLSRKKWKCRGSKSMK